MIVMASLKSGVLLKLLEDMKCDEKDLDDDKKPVLLQIRSIIPVLEEGDLWPNKGFYMKVSDLSHAIYVSLPQEESEMILSNELKLGQFMYVQKLEKSDPVPLLKEITPVHGKQRQCEGSPEDLDSMEHLLNFINTPETDSIVEKGVISEKVFDGSCNGKFSRRLSDSNVLVKSRNDYEGTLDKRFHSLSSWKTGKPGKIRSINNDSDSDSEKSSVSSTSMKRRSWCGSEILGIKERSDSIVIKHEIKSKPRSHCRSANASPVRPLRYESSDDNSSSTRRRVAKKPLLSPTSKKKPLLSPTSKKTPLTNSISDMTSFLNEEKKAAESGISWASLSPTLVKLGKEVIRQRDIALLAAADAMQEACAAERLLNCLSTFSEFHQPEGDDLQPHVDKFFDLQEDLDRTRLIMKSLTNISPVRESESDCTSTSSIKEALSLALERKKNATSWIKSAISVDLTPVSPTLNLITSNTSSITAMTISQAAKRSNKVNRTTKPKGACIVKKHRTSNESSLALASEKDDHTEWSRGSTLNASNDLAGSLQDECRRLFVSYVENFLEVVEKKASSEDSDTQIARMIHKIKKVNDWLDLIVDKEGNGSRDGCKGDSAEIEACSRVRKKMYEILMKFAERSAMALENTSM